MECCMGWEDSMGPNYPDKTVLDSTSWSLTGLNSGVETIEPHNPRTTPIKAMMNIASAILGVVYILLFS